MDPKCPIILKTSTFYVGFNSDTLMSQSVVQLSLVEEMQLNVCYGSRQT